MTVYARAPMRIDFAGGWTDVPAFLERERGVVVNAAITLFVHVECHMGTGRIQLHAEDLGERVSFPSSALISYNGTLDLHKAALNMLPVTGGIEVLSRSDAPGGSGLGASGALDVALLAGLAHCRDETYSPRELAELGFDLETRELALLGGKQDQLAAALGGFHEFVFRGDEVEARRLNVSPEGAAELASHMVVAHSGHSHFSSETHARVWDAFAAGKSDVTNALRSIRDLGSDAASIVEAGDWHGLARIIAENWRSQQRLDATIGTPRLQAIEEAVSAVGAWGLKATGAGAGGCVVILGPAGARNAIADAASRAGATVLDAAFSFNGVTVEASPDARRDA